MTGRHAALALAVAASAAALPATAEAKVCDTPSVYTHIQTRGVGCRQAKRVIRAYFKDGTGLFGLECRDKQYPGGVTTTCKKDIRKIVHYSAD